MTDSVGESGQIAGDSVGEGDRGGAEVESLHRQVRDPGVGWRIRATVPDERGTTGVPPSPAQAGRSIYVGLPCLFGKGQPEPNLKGWDQRVGNRGVTLISAGASHQARRPLVDHDRVGGLRCTDGFAADEAGRSIAWRTLDSSSSIV